MHILTLQADLESKLANFSYFGAWKCKETLTYLGKHFLTIRYKVL